MKCLWILAQRWFIRSRAGVVFLLGLTGLALYLCYLLVAPFLKPILFAFILAIVFPVQAKIRSVRSDAEARFHQ
jgi:predicted PurR-regulated permease PerM